MRLRLLHFAQDSKMPRSSTSTWLFIRPVSVVTLLRAAHRIISAKFRFLRVAYSFALLVLVLLGANLQRRGPVGDHAVQTTHKHDAESNQKRKSFHPARCK